MRSGFKKVPVDQKINVIKVVLGLVCFLRHYGRGEKK